MSDLISRQAAIDELMEMIEQHENDQFNGRLLHWTGIKAMLEGLPSVEPHYDLDGYSSRLWKAAYERGKAEAERKKGKWLPHEDEYGDHCGDKCSVCGEWYVMPDGKSKFCPN